MVQCQYNVLVSTNPLIATPLINVYVLQSSICNAVSTCKVYIIKVQHKYCSITVTVYIYIYIYICSLDLPLPNAHTTQQQQTSNVVLVQQQPQAVVTTVHHGYAPGDQGMVLAVISTFVVVFFFCWFSLICTIPAIVFASNVSHGLI